ncbi:hypothetical protein U9M48_014701 [Paspalum notatum var. saurae]|uniref:Uncharacterized protein n=1 Tax=Paspalum notatum var. saurae TaxID=547442 RepID=A0AAQ3T3B5_PASNO
MCRMLLEHAWAVELNWQIAWPYFSLPEPQGPMSSKTNTCIELTKQTNKNVGFSTTKESMEAKALRIRSFGPINHAHFIASVRVVVVFVAEAIDALGARGSRRSARRSLGVGGRGVGGGGVRFRGVGGLLCLGQRRHGHGDEEEGGEEEGDASASHGCLPAGLRAS